MIVAITGASGFIGRQLAQRFTAAGWAVRAVTRADYEGHRIDTRFVGASVVVHAAGATRAPTAGGLAESNVALTRLTLDAARRAHVQRFIYLSSQAAAGPAASLAAPTTEAMQPSPVEAYGRSKLDAEQAVRGATGLPFVILRPAAVYGPGDRDFLAMHRLARRGVAVHPGNREQWISILHVRDLATAVIAATTDDRALGGTFFLAGDEPVQWRELFRMAARCAGRQLAVDVALPGALVGLGAGLGDLVARVTGRAGLLTSEKVALSKAPFWVCSSRLARERFDFTAPTALQEGICETYHWYLANDWL